MKFTLLDNGADSLKSAYENLETLKNIAEGGQHRLKDSVIFLNHGVELLLKLILKKHSPSLMFDKINEYLEAKQKLKKKEDAKTVFDINKKLKTVSLFEALTRVEYLCDIDIPENFRGSILYVNKIRNQFMHYEVELDEQETETLVTKLQICYEETIEFLEKHIEDLDDIIQDSRFELTTEEYEEQQAEIYAEIYYEDMSLEEMRLEAEYEEANAGDWYGRP
ncbi:hypothetical protein CN505_11910 [Bacillus cereus]|uniref:hypothetical protein n=1 Tax=Bacillus sp. FSL H8-0545 TaxID=2921402 RepID=UPI000BED5BE9|nr:hypothetical protein CON53_29570 [Bacillus cereus]PES77724.1 hypothetical protein CN509_14435 [Bacillus cereus]PET05792.1 hypothetical protein CN505_11910 [Bacillus cereus]PFH81359.1 hypothetical protein COI81_29335 [Bacillus cereus]PFI50253.1 hypothetical protein COI73_07465 [Bacillus cereus]